MKARVIAVVLALGCVTGCWFARGARDAASGSEPSPAAPGQTSPGPLNELLYVLGYALVRDGVPLAIKLAGKKNGALKA